MLSISTGEALERALRSGINHRIKALLRLRRAQLADDQSDSDIANLAHFAIVQPGDTPADLERTIGFSIFRNPADGSRMGEPDFAPGFEWLQNHDWGWEMVWILDDSGFGHVIIIPNEQGVDAELITFCRRYASEHA